MAKYSTFLYGAALYGLTPVIDSISISSGKSTGGDAFTILGENLSYALDDDDFLNPVLDVLDWVDISAGTGTVTPGASHLQMSSGTTAGSIAGLETLDQYMDTQFEAKVTIPKISAFPASTVDLFNMELYTDANNYSRISVDQGSTSGTTTVTASVVVGGVVTDTATATWTTGVSTFKILRWGTTVQFYGNGALLFSSSRSVSTVAKFRYYCGNQSATYDVLCTLEYVKFRTFIAFDNQLVDEVVVVSPFRVRGSTPASVDTRNVSGSYAGLVDISAVTQGTVTRSNFFTYFFEGVLTIAKSDQFGTQLSIVDDSTLRTPSGIDKGLGGGR